MSLDALFTNIETSDKWPGVYIPRLEKRIGLKQLARLNEQGAYLYPDRAFSPSSLKRLVKSGLDYLDYICEPKRTPEEDLEDSYNSRKRAFTRGILFEDMLCLGEYYFQTDKYMVLKSDTIGANQKSQAKEEGKRCVRKTDFELVRAMYHTVAKKCPELVKTLQEKCTYQVQTNGLVSVGDEQIKLNGFTDCELLPSIGLKHGYEIKTIDGAAECENRVFDRPYGSFHYWMQAAVYHSIRNYEAFTFVFVSKKRFHPVVTMHFEEEALDNLVEQLKTLALIPALHYLENGFEKRYFQKQYLKRVNYDLRIY